ncbi:DNA recombination protein RmuC [Croceimicrobium sp.]|uniref:DNA recombination protein RmuC n=1 Tax=Croceimicrobium sp. TaxID=2828340 RepID=UPI003BAC5C2A
MSLVYLFIPLAFVLGFALAWWINQKRPHPALEAEKNQLKNDLALWQTKAQSAEERIQSLEAELQNLRQQIQSYSEDKARLRAEVDHAQERLKEQKSELSDLQKQFSEQFQNLAQKILEEKSERFTQTNKENIEGILKPLNEKIKEFQEKVSRTNLEGAERNSALIQQIKSLQELNHSLKAEAHSLTQALKGESKTQGNWGEYQLERILESAGLQKDIHYRKEVNFKNSENQNQRPDFLLDLPDGKHLILDSKVSLTAYLRYTESEDEAEKARFLKEHLLSIHGHIDSLSKRNYQDLPGVNQPDYVMLFVANEPALHLALAEDPQLFDKALQKNIVLVSTSTLLATLRTISYIWRQDAQNKNAEEIARQAGAMFDKFVNFSDDLMKLGNQMATAQKTYDAAMNKLSEGRGSLVTRAQKLQELGAVNSQKKLDNRLIDSHDEE